MDPAGMREVNVVNQIYIVSFGGFPGRIVLPHTKSPLLLDH